MTSALMFRKRIAPRMGEGGSVVQADWFAARRMTAPLGGLPAHKDLDLVLCDEPYRKTVAPKDLEAFEQMGFWSRNALMVLGPNFRPDVRPNWPEWQVLRAGIGAIDLEIPSRIIPDSVYYRPGSAGLLLEFAIQPEEPGHVIIPVSVVPVFDLPPHGTAGRVDRATGIPYLVADSTAIPEQDIRVLFTRNAMEAGLLVRGADYHGGRQGVDAACGASGRLGVASLTYDLIKLNGDGVLEHEAIRNASLADIQSLAQKGQPATVTSAWLSVSLQEAKDAASVFLAAV